ncbi:MAG: sigma-70 family RNA polymerase sigma factor [Patescibacteria group bacterium]
METSKNEQPTRTGRKPMFDRVFTLGNTRRTTSRYARMPIEQEHSLISIQQQSGGEQSREAAEILIAQHMSMIRGLAGRYLGRGVELDELVHIARNGFFYGITHFKEGHHATLTTYATYWVVSFLAHHFRVLRVKEKQQFMVEDTALDWTDCYSPAMNTEFVRQFEPSPETLCAFRRISDGLMRKMTLTLTPQEKFVLCRYSGFMDMKGPMTLDEISGFYHVTRARIGQIKDEALTKLGISQDRLRAIAKGFEVLVAHT